jgi:hypothetical protein
MDKKLVDDISKIIQSFNESMQGYLPALEKEVNILIETKSKDGNSIEHSLDTLLSLTNHGMADDLFVRLLEYYKTVDSDGAIFYWNQYDEKED